MKHSPFLSINKNINQIHIDVYNTIARTLAETCLDEVDFEKVERLRKVDHQTIVREYMLLKIGMFDTWEILYHYD
ncbi:hypothetical protein LCGC14_1737600 [marine sediment metagenome]|uniref:Uncharacterized protein n=1 Tax=marine sediment metagenome TaxID=412755 RepID=A0A0F9JMX8_9ZZZZ